MGAKSWYFIGDQLCTSKPLYKVTNQYDSSRQLVLKAYDASSARQVKEFKREVGNLTAIQTWLNGAPIVKIVDYGEAYEGM